MEKANKNLYLIIGLIVILVVVVTLVLYFDKAQDKSLSQKIRIEEKQVEEARQYASDTLDLKNKNQRVIDSASRTAASRVRAIDPSDHIMGALDAPVQLIVYNDFEDPFGAQFVAVLKQTKEYFGDQLVIAFRHFPLRSHAAAFLAAQASECAAEQDKFWAMHDKLFQAGEENALSAERIKADAEDMGLDTQKFNLCFESEKYSAKIQAQLDEAGQFNVFGAPASFVNGEPIPGAYPFEDFTDSQEREREGLKTIIERHLED